MHTPGFESLRTTDGFSLTFACMLPPNPTSARAVAIVAPAMGVRQDFYVPFARWLSEQGIVAYTFDYRGTGRSMPKHGLRGFAANLTDWAQLDCERVIAHAREHHPALPIVWIGHSVGAQLLGLIPGANTLHGMLSIAAGSGYYRLNAKPLRYYVKPVLWDVVMPIATRIAGYFPGRRLGMVGDLPAGAALQWRAWCLSPDYAGSESGRVRDQYASVSIPITAWSMQDDEMMTFAGTRALFTLYSGARVDVQRMVPSEHAVSRIGHFGFFRASMQTNLWPRALQWIDQVTTQQHSAVNAA
jgi:predicted alpha/beta hydrolase